MTLVVDGGGLETMPSLSSQRRNKETIHCSVSAYAIGQLSSERAEKGRKREARFVFFYL